MDIFLFFPWLSVWLNSGIKVQTISNSLRTITVLLFLTKYFIHSSLLNGVKWYERNFFHSPEHFLANVFVLFWKSLKNSRPPLLSPLQKWIQCGEPKNGEKAGRDGYIRSLFSGIFQQYQLFPHVINSQFDINWGPLLSTIFTSVFTILQK